MPDEKKPKKPTARAPRELDALDKKTLKLILETAERVRNSIDKRVLPELRFPERSLGNVKYDTKIGYFELGKNRKARALTVNTVKTFAQTLRLMAISKEMVENNDFATKREAYYVSKNWGDAKFNDQPESDTVLDDIEALASLDGLAREQLRYYPEEHGGSVAGNLTVIDVDSETGRPIEIDCTNFGSGSYSIPHSVEHLKFETNAKFIIAIETGGMFQRLNNHKFWKTENCILVETAGVPTRATRRFVRRLADDKKIPVYAFVDCDPYGIANIYRTLKVGSGPVPRRHASGHHRLQAAGRDPQAPRGRHQARQGRPQERPVLHGPQAVDQGHRAAAQDGRARRATGPREVGTQLRDRGIPPAQAGEPQGLPALSRARGALLA
jgi:DNA topoisomerase-6 subunit A